MSTLNSAKKSVKGRPTVDSEAINVRLERQQIVAVDDWRRAEEDMPSRPEAIRRLLVIGLQAVAKSLKRK